MARELNENAVCKITVLKRTIHQDLFQEYLGRQGELCEIFTEGQEFILDSIFNPPEGFCPWAWADLRPLIHGIKGGMRYFDSDEIVGCCTDGMRPVLFKIEMVNPD